MEGGGYQALVRAQQSSSSEHNGGNGSNNKNDDADEATTSNDKRGSVFVPEEEIGIADTGNEIVLKHVCFHYPTRPESEIFRGLNLSVKRGETLALVGPSGQGN